MLDGFFVDEVAHKNAEAVDAVGGGCGVDESREDEEVDGEDGKMHGFRFFLEIDEWRY